MARYSDTLHPGWRSANAIANLARRAGIDADQYAQQHFERSVNNLTQAQAADIIRQLAAKPKT
jgi:hypothetical protein